MLTTKYCTVNNKASSGAWVWYAPLEGESGRGGVDRVKDDKGLAPPRVRLHRNNLHYLPAPLEQLRQLLLQRKLLQLLVDVLHSTASARCQWEGRANNHTLEAQQATNVCTSERGEPFNSTQHKALIRWMNCTDSHQPGMRGRRERVASMATLREQGLQ
jgi:hypothetical protein